VPGPQANENVLADRGSGADRPGAPEIFRIPEQRRGRFLQVLTRAAALSALLFAGDSAAAAGYATPRQRGQEYTGSQQPLRGTELNSPRVKAA
jgi:hypothetical protein